MTNVAVIGCGYWGANYVRLLHELPQARLVAACDTNPQRITMIRERFPLLSVTDSVDDVLNNRWIDAVVIATPATAHYDLVKRALEAGKHVMVEKPLTTTVEEGEDLCATAKTCDRLLMVGLTFLYNSGIAKVKELTADPDFGEVYYLTCTRTNLGPVRPDVSAIWDLASHDIAICDHLLDRRPTWVQAAASTVLDHRLQDVAFITLGYPGNILANIHVSWVDPNKVREVVAVGSRRRIVFDDLNSSERVRIFEKGISSTKQEADSFGEFRLLVRDGDIISPRVAPSEPLRNQMEAFLAGITEGRCVPTSGEVGVENVRTLVAVEKSLAANGGRIDV